MTQNDASCIAALKRHCIPYMETQNEIGTGGPCAMIPRIKALSERLESLPLWPFGLDQV
jgi:hypothetical protein